METSSTSARTLASKASYSGRAAGSLLKKKRMSGVMGILLATRQPVSNVVDQKKERVEKRHPHRMPSQSGVKFKKVFQCGNNQRCNQKDDSIEQSVFQFVFLRLGITYILKKFSHILPDSRGWEPCHMHPSKTSEHYYRCSSFGQLHLVHRNQLCLYSSYDSWPSVRPLNRHVHAP